MSYITSNIYSRARSAHININLDTLRIISSDLMIYLHSPLADINKIVRQSLFETLHNDLLYHPQCYRLHITSLQASTQAHILAHETGFFLCSLQCSSLYLDLISFVTFYPQILTTISSPKRGAHDSSKEKTRLTIYAYEPVSLVSLTLS